MIQNGAILSKKRKIELSTNDQQCKDKMNEQKLTNKTDKSSSSSKSTQLEQNTTDLIQSRASINNKIIKPTINLKINSNLINEFDQFNQQTNLKTIDSPINNLKSPTYYDRLISTVTDDNKLTNDLFNQTEQQQTNQDEMDLNTFNNLDDNSQLINQDEYFTNQDDLDLLNNHNELNQSHSNSSFNFSLINEDNNSNMSTTSSNTQQNTSDFELVDLNDTSSTNLNFTKPNNLNEWLNMFHKWTNNERLSALESLVDSEICDIQQIRFLLSIIEPQLQRDFISLLPKELALYVLSFLKPKDLLKAAQTCRYWRILCEGNYF